MYGSALTFYEDFKDWDKLSDEQKRSLVSVHNSEEETDSTAPIDDNFLSLNSLSIQCEKSICLLSRKPLFQPFKEFLTFLYSFCSTPGDRGSVPVERLISFFMYDVSCPSPEKPLIVVDCGARKIDLTWPSPCSSLPQKGSSFITLLRNIGWELAIELFSLVLFESRIVFHSLRSSVLTTIMETLCSAIFPLKWTGTYIPRCAREMVTSAECPGCAMIGIDSMTYDALDTYDLISPEGQKQICFVDLDTPHLLLAEDKRGHRAEKLLPKKAYKSLKKCLSECHREIDANPSVYGARGGDFLMKSDTNRKKIYNMELRCQEAFLRFMASIMKGYQSYLRVWGNDYMASSPDGSSPVPMSDFQNFSDLFDLNEFLKFHKSTKQFYNEFCHTHSFAHFIHLRSHLMSYNLPMTSMSMGGGTHESDYYVFFDECTDKTFNEEDARLLDVDKGLLVEHCQFITAPEPVDENLSYDYKGIFPKLDPNLFGDYFNDDQFPRSSATTSTAHSLLSTPVHSNKSGSCSSGAVGSMNVFSNGGPGVIPWRTPVENKAAQRNAKNFFEASKPLVQQLNTISHNPYYNQSSDFLAKVSSSEFHSKQWVSYLIMNCYTMWFMLLPAYVSSRTHQDEVEDVLRYAQVFLIKMLEQFQNKDSQSSDEHHQPHHNSNQQHNSNNAPSSVTLTPSSTHNATNNNQSSLTVMPEEVSYRILIHLFHKYGMNKRIYELQQILKKFGVKLNAATYSYLNSMLLSRATAANKSQQALEQIDKQSEASVEGCTIQHKGTITERAQKKKLSKVNLHWCIVVCATKFIILFHKTRSHRNRKCLAACDVVFTEPKELTVELSNVNESDVKSKFDSQGDGVYSAHSNNNKAEVPAKLTDDYRLSEVSSCAKVEDEHQTSSTGTWKRQNSYTARSSTKMDNSTTVVASTKHKRNMSLFGDIDPSSPLPVLASTAFRKGSSSSSQSVNRKLFTNSQLSLASEHEVSARVAGIHGGGSMLAKKPQYSSVGDTLEHRDSTENCRLRVTTPQSKYFDDKVITTIDYNHHESAAEEETTNLHSSAISVNSSMNSNNILEVVSNKNSNNTQNLKSSMLQLSSIASRDNISEAGLSDVMQYCDVEGYDVDSQIFVDNSVPMLLPRSSSTRSSLEGGRSISALHRKAVYLLANTNMAMPLAVSETVKSFFHGSNSTISEDRVGSSSNLSATIGAELGGLGGGGGSSIAGVASTTASLKSDSRENIFSSFTSAANYTQKMFQNPTVSKIKDNLQQVAQEFKYAVSDAPLEPDLDSIKPQKVTVKNDSLKKPTISSDNYQGRFRVKPINSLISVQITSVYSCNNPSCQKTLYDEDIMAQWNYDDSNFSINCPCSKGLTANDSNNKCGKSQLPKLTIMIKDYRHQFLQCGCHQCLSILNRFCPDYAAESILTNPNSNMVVNTCMEEENCSGMQKVSQQKVSDGAFQIGGEKNESQSGDDRSNQMDSALISSNGGSAGGSQLSLLHDASNYSNCDEHSLTSNGGNVRERDDAASASADASASSTILEYSQMNPPSQNQCAYQSATSSKKSSNQPPSLKISPSISPPIELEPVLVNYLSPLVVRKILERLIEKSSTSYDILYSPEMVDEKRDIYWNLVWYFTRLHFKTHLYELLLNSRLLNSDNSLASLLSTTNQKWNIDNGSDDEDHRSCVVEMNHSTNPPSSSNNNSLCGDKSIDCYCFRRKCELSDENTSIIFKPVQVDVLWDKLISSELKLQRKSVDVSDDITSSVPWETEAPLFFNWLKNEEAQLDKLDLVASSLPDRWRPDIAKSTLDPVFGEKTMESVLKDMLKWMTKVPKPNLDIAHFPTNNPNRRGLHREMLFMIIAALKAGKVDIRAFYQAYNEAYWTLKGQPFYESKFLGQDSPPNILSVAFASQFGHLLI